MATIFTLKDDDLSEKINMDELYEKQQHDNLETLKLYQKILGRIHVRIRNTSRQRNNEQFCTFLVPEVIIGVPKYNNAECIAYLISKLEENGFAIKYIHPNLLFISWKQWIPGFVRSEIKKKTGMVVDGRGSITDRSDKSAGSGRGAGVPDDPNKLLLTGGQKAKAKKETKEFKDINTYVPSGNTVFNPSILKKL